MFRPVALLLVVASCAFAQTPQDLPHAAREVLSQARILRSRVF